MPPRRARRPHSCMPPLHLLLYRDLSQATWAPRTALAKERNGGPGIAPQPWGSGVGGSPGLESNYEVKVSFMPDENTHLALCDTVAVVSSRRAVKLGVDPFQLPSFNAWALSLSLGVTPAPLPST